MMQEEQGPTTRSELLERLRNLDALQSQGTLAELAYRRAREALEKALDEAGKIRLEALEDARATREREMALLMESLRALRLSAEAQIQSVLTSAEVEAHQTRERAQLEAERRLEEARRQAEAASAEAAAVRASAEQRAREVESLEREFNEMVERFVTRLGISEQPEGGWLRGLFGGKANK
jgi:hypothetical protein